MVKPLARTSRRSTIESAMTSTFVGGNETGAPHYTARRSKSLIKAAGLVRHIHTGHIADTGAPARTRIARRSRTVRGAARRAQGRCCDARLSALIMILHVAQIDHH